MASPACLFISSCVEKLMVCSCTSVGLSFHMRGNDKRQSTNFLSVVETVELQACSACFGDLQTGGGVNDGTYRRCTFFSSSCVALSCSFLFLSCQFANKYGLAGLLKEGNRSFTGVDEVTARNIEAAKALSDITRTSLGRHVSTGMLSPACQGMTSLLSRLKEAGTDFLFRCMHRTSWSSFL